MSKTHGITRTGYRYGIVPVQELVDQAQGAFAQTCPVEWCWMHIQGGDQARIAHMRTVHGSEPWTEDWIRS